MNFPARTISDQSDWDRALISLPNPHILQSWEWGEFKRRTVGWSPERWLFERDGEPVGAASVLTRRIGPLAVMYVPRGPILDWADTRLADRVLSHLEEMARRHGAILIKIDPAMPIGYGVPGGPDEAADPDGERLVQRLRERGWRFSPMPVQFRNTLHIDLTREEETILAAMKQKTRYNIRLAGRKGVKVRAATPDDLPMMYQLYAETARRDGFVIRPMGYYRDAWGSFIEAGLAHGLIAEYEGEPLAHVVLMRFGDTAWYFYGASSNRRRNLMPTYLLQWEAIRWAKSVGCRLYDLWGAPDKFDESDPMWGVYRFKAGLGGRVVRYIGAWDWTPAPLLYRAYVTLMPRVLDVMRRRGMRRPGK